MRVGTLVRALFLFFAAAISLPLASQQSQASTTSQIAVTEPLEIDVLSGNPLSAVSWISETFPYSTFTQQISFVQSGSFTVKIVGVNAAGRGWQ